MKTAADYFGAMVGEYDSLIRRAVPRYDEMTKRLLDERLGSADASFVATTFETMKFEPESFDLVASTISLHHVRDKAPLYRALRRLIRVGGTFRFADQMAGGTEANHSINWTRWLEFCREPGHCTEAEITSLLDHAEAHDHYTPVAEHFRMLEAAGFKNPDCVWRNLIWGIVTADL